MQIDRTDINAFKFFSKETVMKSIKLAVFDLEGTLVKNSFRDKEFPSIWKVLCNLCGPDAAAEDAENTRRYYAGGYPGYTYWVLDTIKILKKYGLKRKLFYDVIGALDLYPGVAETMAALGDHGIRTAIISGGLKALVDRVAIEYGIEHCFAAAEFFWGEGDTLRHWNVMPTDFHHKSSLLGMLCHELRISRNECAFVGDGRNDKDVAGYAGLSIGFNPHDELKESASIIIEQGKGREDLSAVIKPILQYPFFSPQDFLSGNVLKLNSSPSSPPSEDSTVANLSGSSKRGIFHAFLVRSGLTPKSADSYCSYLNNLCRNIAATAWNGADESNAFTALEQAARETSEEMTFIENLAHPLAGPHGRENDLTSVAKQFHRFSNVK